MKRVAIWPSPWNYKLRNGIFEMGFGPGGAYRKPFQMWRDLAGERGFQLDTWDEVPEKAADVIWFIDLPRTKAECLFAKSRYPNAASVLMICESPLICPQMFLESNRARFDHVVTYEQKKTGPKTTTYRLPVPIAEPRPGPSFSDRRLLGMINSNRVEGLFAMRQLGLPGLPGIGRLFNGWRNGIGGLRRSGKSDLYIERRRICRSFDRRPDLEIDIFGKGWSGEQISWFPLYRNPSYKCCRSTFVEDRVELLSGYRFSLAFENWQGEADYITDRIFDAFLAGSVPVYRGDNRIHETIPGDSFIDAASFRDHEALIHFLSRMPEAEWEKMRRSGDSFLKSKEAANFSEETFAGKMCECLRKVSR